MFCEKCGNQIPDNARFCGQCGAAVTPDAGTATELPVSKNVKSEKRKIPVWVLGSMVLAIGIIVAAIIGFILSSGFHLQHEWIKATCTEPRTCVVGGETEGNALGHAWEEATCTNPKICSVCGQTEGSARGHVWVEATCTEPKTCSTCGETEGMPLEHEWWEATCTEPRTCYICGKTEGSTIDHDLNSYGKCVMCGRQIGTMIADFYDFFTFTSTSPYESPFTITVTPLKSGYHYGGTVSFAVTQKDIVDVNGDLMTLSGYRTIELDELGNGSFTINFNPAQVMIIYEFNDVIAYYY